MNAWDWAQSRLVGGSGETSLSTRLRARRWRRFEAAFPDIGQMRVVDLGGTVESWSVGGVRPAHVTLVNRWPSEAPMPPWIDEVVGDACSLPDALVGRGFDLVYSNSVIEHVGGYARRLDFARSVEVLAPAHWIQTPNRYFPIEPHWLFPGFQFLPVRARCAVAPRWPLYAWRSTDRERTLREVLEIELVGRTEFASYFPDSRILVERVLGLSKSFIAVRT